MALSLETAGTRFVCAGTEHAKNGLGVSRAEARLRQAGAKARGEKTEKGKSADEAAAPQRRGGEKEGRRRDASATREDGGEAAALQRRGGEKRKRGRAPAGRQRYKKRGCE